MYLGKRKLDPNELNRHAPPSKIARQLEQLYLSDVDDSNAEMDGIEGENFTYIDKNTLLKTSNEVDIDDRFLKIPKSISISDDRKEKKDPTASMAVIPYKGS